jgi:hypothetical protein
MVPVPGKNNDSTTKGDGSGSLPSGICDLVDAQVLDLLLVNCTEVVGTD